RKRIASLAPDLANSVPGPHANSPVEWTCAPADHDTRTKNDDWQAFFEVHRHEDLLRSRLGARIQVAPGDPWIKGCCLGDRAGACSGVVGIDRSGVEEPLDLVAETQFSNVSSNLDILACKLAPARHVGPGQVIDDPAARDRPLEIIGPQQIAGDDLDLRALEFLGQAPGVAHQEPDLLPLCDELPGQLLANESRPA